MIDMLDKTYTCGLLCFGTLFYHLCHVYLNYVAGDMCKKKRENKKRVKDVGRRQVKSMNEILYFRFRWFGENE